MLDIITPVKTNAFGSTSDKLLASTRGEVIAMMDRLHVRGAGGIVLGCTELRLPIEPGDVIYPAFDTTGLHAFAASLREAAVA